MARPFPREVERAAWDFTETLEVSAPCGFVLRVCPTCAHMELVRAGSDIHGLHLVWMDEELAKAACSSCLEVQARAPEVVQWVLRVVYLRSLLDQERAP